MGTPALRWLPGFDDELVVFGVGLVGLEFVAEYVETGAGDFVQQVVAFADIAGGDGLPIDFIDGVTGCFIKTLKLVGTWSEHHGGDENVAAGTENAMDVVVER